MSIYKQKKDWSSDWALDMSDQEIQTVPDQALSLAEILERFTRNEEVPVGMKSYYDDGDEDLGKIEKADLVDKFAYIEQMAQLGSAIKAHEEAEAERIKKEAYEKLLEEQREKLRKETAAAGSDKNTP